MFGENQTQLRATLPWWLGATHFMLKPSLTLNFLKCAKVICWFAKSHQYFDDKIVLENQENPNKIGKIGDFLSSLLSFLSIICARASWNPDFCP